MRKYFCMVALILLLCASCAEHQVYLADAPDVVKVPDAVIEETGIVTEFFDSPNVYTVTRVAEARSNVAVGAALAHYGEKGYQFRADHSFVTQSVADAAEFDMVVLALENVRDAGRDAVHLFCVSKEDRLVVLPFCVSKGLTDSPESFNEPVGKLSFEVFEPFLDASSAAAPGGADWSWRSWGSCVAGGIIGGGTGCLLHCRIVPLAYFKCVGFCTAGHAFAALARCSYLEIFAAR